MAEQREIKFDVITESGGKLYSGIYLLSNMLTMVRIDYITGSKLIAVRQYTGLIDATRREWIEGDICESIDTEDDTRYMIVFENGAFRKKYADWDESLARPLIDSFDLLHDHVVGDFYHAPDLLVKTA